MVIQAAGTGSLEAVVDWDALAAVYGRQLFLERRAVEAALDLAQAAPADVLLDAGTGTGAVLRALAARPVRPRTAIGVDASPRMLERVPPLPAGWRVQRADLRELPAEDRSVDVAIASYVLHVLEPGARRAALAELRRVLRPRARLVTVTVYVPGRPRLRPLEAALETLARVAPHRLGALQPLDPRPGLIDAGFRLERVRVTALGYPSLCVAARAPD
jgi:ubiquinone/menaquinone biosynthesis C-methylase UbiE